MITNSRVVASLAYSPFTNGSRLHVSCPEYGRALRCR